MLLLTCDVEICRRAVAISLHRAITVFAKKCNPGQESLDISVLGVEMLQHGNSCLKALLDLSFPVWARSHVFSQVMLLKRHRVGLILASKQYDA